MLTYNIFVFGVDKAGKTALTQSVRQEKSISNTIPTLAFNIDQFLVENITFNVWDAPGQQSLRKIWNKGYERAKIMVFVLDVSQKERFEEARVEFLRVLSDPLTRGLPIIFCHHKMDLPDAQANIAEAKIIFQLDQIKYRKIVEIETTVMQMSTINQIKQAILDEVLFRAKKNEALTIVLGEIVHDFRNILDVVLNHTRVLRQECESQNPIASINSIENAAIQGKTLIDQFSPAEMYIKRHPSLENIHDLLENSVSFMFRGTNCTSSLDSDPNLPKIHVNAEQISQVLNNILLNAIESMPRGGNCYITLKKIMLSEMNVHGHILRRLTDEPIKEGSYAMISIADEGVGMTQHEQESLFNMFFTTKPGRMGLGLASSYSIIHQHNGYISYKSAPEAGTTFYLYFLIHMN